MWFRIIIITDTLNNNGYANAFTDPLSAQKLVAFVKTLGNGRSHSLPSSLLAMAKCFRLAVRLYMVDRVGFQAQILADSAFALLIGTGNQCRFGFSPHVFDVLFHSLSTAYFFG